MSRYSFKINDEVLSVNIDEHNVLLSNVNQLDIVFNYKESKYDSVKWFFSHKEKLWYTIKFLDNKQINVYLIELLYKKRLTDYNIIFANNNYDDMRIENIIFEKKHNYIIPDNYIVIKSFNGHISIGGKDNGKIKNPYWQVKDKSTNQIHYIMYCEPNKFVKFSSESQNIILNINGKIPTWYVMENGYVACSNCGKKTNYMHQIVLTNIVERQEGKSVDHINRNKLDNTIHNLRWATQSEQNENTDKRKRKHNAKELPNGIKQEDLPKYIVYYKEKYGTGENTREYFKIEKHPKQEKHWMTSKSCKVTIHEKLKQAKQKLCDFDA